MNNQPPENADVQRGRAEALDYVLSLCQTRAVGKSSVFRCALEDMAIFVEAAKLRNETGEQLSSVSYTQ